MAAKEVDALYELRDTFFNTRSYEESKDRQAQLDALKEAALKTINAKLAEETNNNSSKSSASGPSLAELYYLKGKALNVSDSSSKDAEEALSKALKLHPDLVDGWNCLGECFWKKGDLAAALGCFQSLLSKTRNKTTLCHLSMLLRQAKTDTLLAKAQKTQESIVLAKEAVALDVKDGHSWFVLGNAYFTLFFTTMEDIKTLLQALKAYHQAELDTTQAKNNPDLHFNRANIYRYQEEYGRALEGFQHALLIDPTFSSARDQIDSLRALLLSIHSKIHQKAVKGKVGQTLSSFTYSSQKNESFLLQALSKNTLNQSKYLECLVVDIITEEKVPQTFICVDRSNSWFCLTVFNMDPGAIPLLAELVVPDPFLRHLDVNLEQANPGNPSPALCSYSLVRVDNPISLRVNGLSLGASKLAKSTVAVSTQGEK